MGLDRDPAGEHLNKFSGGTKAEIPTLLRKERQSNASYATPRATRERPMRTARNNLRPPRAIRRRQTNSATSREENKQRKRAHPTEPVEFRDRHAMEGRRQGEDQSTASTRPETAPGGSPLKGFLTFMGSAREFWAAVTPLLVQVPSTAAEMVLTLCITFRATSGRQFEAVGCRARRQVAGHPRNPDPILRAETGRSSSSGPRQLEA